MQLFVDKIYKFHANQESVSQLTRIIGDQKSADAGVKKAIDIWAPQVLVRIEKIGEKLRPDQIEGHQRI